MSKKIIFQRWQEQAKSTKMQDPEMVNDMMRIIHWMACRPRPTLPRKTKMTQLGADIGQIRRVVKHTKNRPRRSSATKRELSKSSVDNDNLLAKRYVTSTAVEAKENEGKRSTKIKLNMNIHNSRAKTARTSNQKTG